MITGELVNPNPIVHQTKTTSKLSSNYYSGTLDAIDIFDIIRNIKDPEHPYTLEQLNVLQEESIKVREDDGIKDCTIDIEFTPTVPHCSLATTIGLCIREKLKRELPRSNGKIDIHVTKGTHSYEEDVNKQINDKERVAAAMENPHLRSLVYECIKD